MPSSCKHRQIYSCTRFTQNQKICEVRKTATMNSSVSTFSYSEYKWCLNNKIVFEVLDDSLVQANLRDMESPQDREIMGSNPS